MKFSQLYLALPFIALVACQKDPTVKNWDYMPNMVYQPSYRAYSENPNTADGKTMQHPVAGTVARGQHVFPYEPMNEDDAVRAGKELKNPLPSSPEVLARGKEVFEINCMVCHGVNGLGDGPVAAKFVPPPSFKDPKFASYQDGRFYYDITLGWGAMASYAQQVQPKDRWALVHYIRELQKRN